MTTKSGGNDNRGGYRPGAGRKPNPENIISDYHIKKMIAAAKKVEKETGVSLDEVLVRIAYSAKSSAKDKLTAIKIFKEYTMTKSTETNINLTQQIGPQIGLPELKPLPDNVISINKEGE